MAFTFFTKSLIAKNFPSSLPTNTRSCSTVVVVVFLYNNNKQQTLNVNINNCIHYMHENKLLCKEYLNLYNSEDTKVLMISIYLNLKPIIINHNI